MGALALLACRPAPEPVAPAPTPAPSPAAAPTVKLGAALDLSTPDGVARWQAAGLAVERANAAGGVPSPGGRPARLELVTYRIDGQADAAVPALRRLATEDGAVAALASVADEATVREAARLGLPTIALGAARQAGPPGPWAFVLAADQRDAVTLLAEYVAAGGVGRVGWIAPRWGPAERARRALVEEAGRRGLRIVAEEAYPTGAEPSPDALARLAFAGAEAIVGWPRDAADGAALVRAAAERARGVRLYVGPDAAMPALLDRAGEAADGMRAISGRMLVAEQLWADDPLTAPTRELVARYRARHGVTPPLAAATGWDAVRIVVAAIERSGLGRAALRDAIARTEEFPGASGAITFAGGGRGLDGGAFIVVRAERGAWTIPPP